MRNLIIRKVIKKFFPPKKSKHLLLGKRGEKLARRLIRNLEMQILCRNFSCVHGEIDLIARDGATLCFIEVKSRTFSKRSRPIDSVTQAKKKNITRTAKYYLHKIGNPAIAYRFDIIEIVFKDHKVVEVRYWPNEFGSSNTESNNF